MENKMSNTSENNNETIKELVSNILGTAQEISKLENQKLVEKIVDKLIDRGDSLAVATHYGEPSILLCDVINIINNVAETDYKRYSAYSSRLRYTENHPCKTNELCGFCQHYWRNHRKENYQGCLGIKLQDEEKFNSHKKPCKKFLHKEGNIQMHLE